MSQNFQWKRALHAYSLHIGQKSTVRNIGLLESLQVSTADVWETYSS